MNNAIVCFLLGHYWYRPNPPYSDKHVICWRCWQHGDSSEACEND